MLVRDGIKIERGRGEGISVWPAHDDETIEFRILRRPIVQNFRPSSIFYGFTNPFTSEYVIVQGVICSETGETVPAYIPIDLQTGRRYTNY